MDNNAELSVMQQFLNDVLYTLVSTAVMACFLFLWRSLGEKITLTYYRYRQDAPCIFRYVTLLIWIVSGIVVYVHFQIVWVVAAYFLSTVLMLMFFLRDRNKFDAVGIVGADKEIRKGVDYRQSLTMCTNRLKFLGTGAYKLTSSEEFEKAINRCVPNEPIQILLCKPTETALEEGAVRYGMDKDAYKGKVVESLRKLSNLKGRYKNIEVRFYSHYQVFRLMFVDNSICLMSYNVLGSGDGSTLPQIHVLNAAHGQSEKQSFYYPLSKYFDDLWNKADIWDFGEYLH